MKWFHRLAKLKGRLCLSRGNAVLISLIIMASALAISLGMASIVAGEIRNTGLIAPSERAYYKAESFIEQALLQKKQDQNYNVANLPALKQSAPTGYVCATEPATPCFSTTPNQLSGTLLSLFLASTSPTGGTLSLRPQDKSFQLDVVSPAGQRSATVGVTLGTIDNPTNFRGVEVSIIASPKSGTPVNQYPTTGPPTTPVFVDKKILTNSQSLTIGQDALLPITGEPYPSLTNSFYRLRLKSLGSGATVTVTPPSGLDLRSTDFTVQAVAEDGNARRGVQVLAPAATQIAGVFDYVLFTDLNLEKEAKVPAETFIQSIIGEVYRIPPLTGVAGNPTPPCANTGGVPRAGVNVTLSDGQSQLTNAAGRAVFNNLAPGVPYYLTGGPVAGHQYCTPQAQPQPAPPGTPLTPNETRTTRFTVRPICAQVERFRWELRLVLRWVEIGRWPPGSGRLGTQYDHSHPGGPPPNTYFYYIGFDRWGTTHVQHHVDASGNPVYWDWAVQERLTWVWEWQWVPYYTWECPS